MKNCLLTYMSHGKLRMCHCGVVECSDCRHHFHERENYK